LVREKLERMRGKERREPLKLGEKLRKDTTKGFEGPRTRVK